MNNDTEIALLELEHRYGKEIRDRVEQMGFVIPKIGRWFVLDECANEGVYCSECHKKVFKIDYSNTMKWKNFKFCPNCGADMRGEENE